MQTTTERSTRARKPAAEKLPYPDLPDEISPSWYIAWHLRLLAQMDAVSKHWRAENSKKHANEPLVMALIGCESELRSEVKKSSYELVEKGLLMFAWPGTTYLQQVAA